MPSIIQSRERMWAHTLKTNLKSYLKCTAGMEWMLLMHSSWELCPLMLRSSFVFIAASIREDSVTYFSSCCFEYSSSPRNCAHCTFHVHASLLLWPVFSVGFYWSSPRECGTVLNICLVPFNIYNKSMKWLRYRFTYGETEGWESSVCLRPHGEYVAGGAVMAG